MIILSTTLPLRMNTFYFDDHQGGIYNTSGYTATPEPISSVLFLSGGAVFAVRRHLRKRGSKKY